MTSNDRTQFFLSNQMSEEEKQQYTTEVLAKGIHSRDKEIQQLQEENRILKSSMKTLLLAWQRGDSYEFYEDLIEKHKLLEP